MFRATFAVLAAVGAALAGCGRPTRPNLLLVTVDTLRADRVGAYGYAAARTPAMDRLAREGVRCADAVAAAPITLPSHSTLLTGLWPPAHGVRDNGAYALGEEAVTLAERLHGAGWRTQAVVSAVVLGRRYNLDQGFEGYDDDLWAEDEPKLFMIRDRPGPRTAERAVAWLGKGRAAAPRRPFFLWVHLFDPHQPYAAPMAERLRSPSPYDAEVAVADRAVGRIVETLRGWELLDDTLVVLTADHGESLGEHGEKTHAVFVYDATVRVPLLLRWPRGLPAGRVYAGPVRGVDLVPTVLAALGVAGGDSTQGRDLLPALAGAAPPPDLPQYSESLLSEVGFGMAPLFAVRAGGFKWIRAPRPELYDLGRDPRELRNLFPSAGGDLRRRARGLDRTLSALLAESARRGVAAPRSPLDRETLENLRALGYLAPAGARRGLAGMDPKDGMALYAKLEEARHLAQRDHWAEAEARLREVLAATPANVAARNVLALARLRQGDAAGARAEYLRSLADDPGQARVHVLLGALALAEGDLDAAERQWRRALQIAPGFVEAMAHLGMAAALRGDEPAAERWYRRALAADPAAPQVHRRLADLRYERGEWAPALAGYERTLAAQPDDFAATVQAGNSARRAGDRAGARRYLLRARRLRPDSWIPAYNLACLAATGGESERALELLAESARKGLRRPDLLAEDGDLAALRPLPAFRRLQDRVAARAAAPELQ
ncbi:MAG TPA: sulfatase-like hydrolase/transferase [Thermoanaerobaculia bacterium]|nr:sulfatase-like hydrolase/transferase [Thermoanaerobaculia bacterium]